MEFQELLDYCQSQAIASAVAPDEDSIWRSLCRTYSKTFHTPLNEVMAMSPRHVVLSVYEEQIEALDLDKYENLEKLQDTIMNILDPNYEAEKESKLADDIAQYEREEEERVKAGRAIHPSLAKKKSAPEKTVSENENPPAENKPTSGSIDLSYFEKEDSES